MNSPSFTQVRNDLVAHFYALALAQDQMLRPDASELLLGLGSTSYIHDWPDYGAFDISKFRLGSEIEALYRYAFHAELVGPISDDPDDGNLRWLTELRDLVTTSTVDPFLEEIRDHFDGEAADQKAIGLAELAALASARYALDSGYSMSLADIALLADMDERSVRNALHAKGSAGLLATRSAGNALQVAAVEASRWLEGRRSFRPTVQIGTSPGYETTAAVPERLDAQSLMPFLCDRMADRFPQRDYPDTPVFAELRKAMANRPKDPMGIDRELAASRLVWPRERLDRILDEGLEALSIRDCAALARELHIDTKWFTDQVRMAKPADAVEQEDGMEATTATLRPRLQFDPAAGTLEATLTEAGIRNGYVDMPRRFAEKLFPADTFGSRGADAHGIPVEVHHDQDDSPWITDLRVKSEAIVSPRKRLTAYFKAHRAQPGDLMRFEQIGERTYRIEFVSKQQ